MYYINIFKGRGTLGTRAMGKQRKQNTAKLRKGIPHIFKHRFKDDQDKLT